MTTKRCTQCREEKPLDQFAMSVAGRRPNGDRRPPKRRATCRECKRAHDREKKQSRLSVKFAADRAEDVSSAQSVEQEFRQLRPWPWPPGVKVFEDVPERRQVAAYGWAK